MGLFAGAGLFLLGGVAVAGATAIRVFARDDADYAYGPGAEITHPPVTEHRIIDLDEPATSRRAPVKTGVNGGTVADLP